MAKRGATPADLLITAFEVIAEDGWRGLRPAAIARRAGVSLVEVYRAFPSRGDLLAAVMRRADEAMLGFDESDLSGLPPRDRVFELFMRRLEALQPYRAGLRRIARERPGDPAFLLPGVCRLDQGLAWLQEAAGLEAGGLRARIGRSVLGAAYLRTLAVWFEDESADMARTMAELDRALRWAEPFAGMREHRREEMSGGETAEPAT